MVIHFLSEEDSVVIRGGVSFVDKPLGEFVLGSLDDKIVVQDSWEFIEDERIGVHEDVWCFCGLDGGEWGGERG